MSNGCSSVLPALVLLVFLWGFGQVYGSVPDRDRQGQGQYKSTCLYEQIPVMCSSEFSFFISTCLYSQKQNSHWFRPLTPAVTCRFPGASVSQRPSITLWRHWSPCWCLISHRNTKTTWTPHETPITASLSLSRWALQIMKTWLIINWLMMQKRSKGCNISQFCRYSWCRCCVVKHLGYG